MYNLADMKGLPQQVTGKAVEEMMAKFPSLPSMTIAKKLLAEFPELFTTLDNARSSVRYYRGTIGNAARGRRGIAERPEPAQHANAMGIPNPFHLPDSDEPEWEPYVIPPSVTRLLVLSDVHIPYHNIEAVTLALQYGKDKGVNGIMLNGDILDFYGLSSFEKDPRKRRFSEELEMGRQFLRVLRKEFDGVPIYYKLGNHCERYERYLRIKAPELLDVSEFRLDVLLKFGELGIELIDDMRIVHFGRLNIMHGHEFGRSVFSPVNPARGAYMRAKENCIIGHHHQTSSHAEPTMNGKVINTWSTGCLCELHPTYMPINKWNRGFAYVEREPDGDFTVHNHTIINGKVR
jgi:predicted phosphodiesterase